MKLFPNGHATHPQWRMAAALVLAQLRAQMAPAALRQRARARRALHHGPLRAGGGSLARHARGRTPGGDRLERHGGRGRGGEQCRVFRRAGPVGDAAGPAAGPIPRVLGRGAAVARGIGRGRLRAAHGAGACRWRYAGPRRADRGDVGPHRVGLPVRRHRGEPRAQRAVRGGRQRQHRGPGRGAGGVRRRPVGRGVRQGRGHALARDPGMPAGRPVRADHARAGQLGARARRRARAGRAAGHAGHHPGRRSAARAACPARDAGRAGGRGLPAHGAHGPFRHGRARAPSRGARSDAAWRGPGRQGGGGHAARVLPAQRGGGARRPDAHLRRDPRGTGAGAAGARGRPAAVARRRTCGADARAGPCHRGHARAHDHGGHLRELFGPGRAALRRARRRNADRAARPGRRAAGGGSSRAARSPTTGSTATPAC